MNNEKNTDNEKILITEEMIPMASDNGEPKTIRIVVDEHPAKSHLNFSLKNAVQSLLP